jgi:hypothetical protein
MRSGLARPTLLFRRRLRCCDGAALLDFQVPLSARIGIRALSLVGAVLIGSARFVKKARPRSAAAAGGHASAFAVVAATAARNAAAAAAAATAAGGAAAAARIATATATVPAVLPAVLAAASAAPGAAPRAAAAPAAAAPAAAPAPTAAPAAAVRGTVCRPTVCRRFGGLLRLLLRLPPSRGSHFRMHDGDAELAHVALAHVHRAAVLHDYLHRSDHDLLLAPAMCRGRGGVWGVSGVRGVSGAAAQRRNRRHIETAGAADGRMHRAHAIGAVGAQRSGMWYAPH